MNRRSFMKIAGTAVYAFSLVKYGQSEARAANDAGKLNILILTADDMSCDSVGAFGCKVAQTTPNLDRLADEGMRFERAHTNIAVCQPCRSVLITGLYPHRSGSEGFTNVRDDVPILTETFSKAGYLVGILGKLGHARGKAESHLDFSKDQPELGLGRDPQKYYQYTCQMLARAKTEKRPFFFIINSHDPHRPFHGSQQEAGFRGFKGNLNERAIPSKIFKPEEITVPGFLPDIPDVRTEIAQYYSSVRRCDDVMGKVLSALDENGFRENTFVMFFSDHGISAPFSKTNCYLVSTKTPLIIRWPGMVKPGVDKKHMLSAVDFAPTLLQAAGLGLYDKIDGKSFLPLLQGKAFESDSLVFTQFHETSGTRRYPMRCVQDEHFGYICNFWSDGKTTFINEGQSGLTWKALVNAAKTDVAIKERVRFYSYRVPEEFYDLQNDPDCLKNLIDDAKFKPEIETKRNQLREWMIKMQDRALAAFDEQANRKSFIEAENNLKAPKKNAKRNRIKRRNTNEVE